MKNKVSFVLIGNMAIDDLIQVPAHASKLPIAVNNDASDYQIRFLLRTGNPSLIDIDQAHQPIPLEGTAA